MSKGKLANLAIPETVAMSVSTQETIEPKSKRGVTNEI